MFCLSASKVAKTTMSHIQHAACFCMTSEVRMTFKLLKGHQTKQNKTKLQEKKDQIRSDQSLSRVRLCDPMNRSTPGLPVHHQRRIGRDKRDWKGGGDWDYMWLAKTKIFAIWTFTKEVFQSLICIVFLFFCSSITEK